LPAISCRDFPPATRRKRSRYLTETKTSEKGHGRRTQRQLAASTRIVPLLSAKWPGLAQVLRLERTTRRCGNTTREVEYAITSLPSHRAGAAELLTLWRGHWGIENREHWIRDTHWREDRCRVRLRHGAHNLAAFRNAAINLLRLANTTNLAAALRENAYRVERLFARLGIIKL
jgi:predicted transposase YbfD/YdcC